MTILINAFITIVKMVTPKTYVPAHTAFSMIEMGSESPYPTVDRVVSIKYIENIILSQTSFFSPRSSMHELCLRP